jgi:ABC-type lipopolysaccharide export system ATPase subunit
MALALADRPSPGGLVVEALSHAYGARTVVKEVELELPAGEVHCLVGPKTTILRLIGGLGIDSYPLALDAMLRLLARR